MSLENTWDRIHAWLVVNAPVVSESLAPPANDDQIRDAERAMSVTFPEDVRDCYRIHNGQRAVSTPASYDLSLESVPGFLDGEEWLSLEGLVANWQIKKELLDEGVFRRAGSPRGPVRPVWWHPAWVPLTTDAFGYLKCLDLAPAPGGRVGQVIYWEKDEPSRGVTAAGLAEWLAWFAEGLEQGDYVTAPEKYGFNLVSIDAL